MDLGLLVLRVVFGGLFAAHGTQKLFGWFKGYGIKGTGGFFESLGYRPGPLMAGVAGASEVGAGLLIGFGLLTPLGAAAVVGVMLNAILTAKRNAGLFGGYELDLLYAFAAVALGFTGAGAYSLDGAIGWSLSGAVWGAASVALGLVVGGLTLAARRQAPVVAAVEEDVQRAA